jgi:hypothetical protein
VSQRKTKRSGRWFQDRHQRWWKVVLNAEIVAAIRQYTGISLSALAHQPEELGSLLLGSQVEFLKVMGFACGSQIEERGLSPQQFLDAFLDHEPTYTAAGMALFGAIADLYPTSVLGQGAPSIIREWQRGKKTA